MTAGTCGRIVTTGFSIFLITITLYMLYGLGNIHTEKWIVCLLPIALFGPFTFPIAIYYWCIDKSKIRW